MQSSDGLLQLQIWLTEGLSLNKIARQLAISDHTFYAWRKYREISDVLEKAGYTTAKGAESNSQPAYYIVYESNRTRRMTKILASYPSSEALWNSDFISEYFAAYRVLSGSYRADYINKLMQDSVYHLSNLYMIVYGIKTRGKIVPKTPFSKS